MATTTTAHWYKDDYKTAFSDAVADLIEEGIEDRAERMLAVQALIDAYIDSVGETPDGEQLERLTDYILAEELTDKHKNKVSATEYPFMSTWQLDVRRNREYSVDLAENHGTDGVNYNLPTRRRRRAKEMRFIDKVSQIKNKRRNAQYRKDTAPGEIVRYNLTDGEGFTPEFVQCRDISYNVIPEYYR
jgi:hypothetical protein